MASQLPMWTQSIERVAYHEVGHAVVDQLLSGTTSGCSLSTRNNEWLGMSPPLSISTPFVSMGVDQFRAYVAGLWGGWAAVNLAITSGLLQEEPCWVEARPGDRGFFAGVGSDSDNIGRVLSQRNPLEHTGFADEARHLALDTLGPRMTQVEVLAKALASSHRLDRAAIITALV